MRLIEEMSASVPVGPACEALGVSRATLYRHRRMPLVHAPKAVQRACPRRLSPEEQEHLLAVLRSQEFADQPPREVYATLLERGQYLASIRTMYRLLAQVGEVHERRNQRSAQKHTAPVLTSTGPNEVWTWDITKLATLRRGVYLQAYVIIDLFSRYVVGWLVAESESKELAAALFADTIVRHGIRPGLVVHADRGSAMRSDTLAQLLAALGATRSFSRPHVSNDNPFSEAQFKTLKYQPDYPERFAGLEHARGWLQSFFGWHNQEYHHTGLALFTPADVYFERVEKVAVERQNALSAAYDAHPERFPHGPPKVQRPPTDVHINHTLPAQEAPVDAASPERKAPRNAH